MSAKATDCVVVHAFGKHVVAVPITLTKAEKAGIVKLAGMIERYGVKIRFV